MFKRIGLAFVVFLVLGTALPYKLMANTSSGILDKIIQNQNINVCIWPDYYSISYRDPRSYKLLGIDVDLATMLADDLGVKLNFIDSSFAKLVPDLLQNRCDIAMFAVGITDERKKQLKFTSPYLVSDVLGITTKANRKIQTWEDIDQPGVVVSVAKGTFLESLMLNKLQHATLLVGDSPHARELAVESGRADVFLTDFPYTRRMLKTTDWARLVVPSGKYHLTYYAWALAPGDITWFNRVQGFLAAVKSDGRLLAAAQKHDLEPIVVLD